MLLGIDSRFFRYPITWLATAFCLSLVMTFAPTVAGTMTAAVGIANNVIRSVQVNSSSTGALTGSLSDSTIVTNHNLTTEGTTDWALWGTGANTSLAPVIRKSGGTAISNLTAISHGNDLRGLGQFGSISHTFQWQNGTPTASASAVAAGIQHNNGEGGASGLNEGFSFTVPADTTTRRIRIYSTHHKSIGQVTAILSDNSAANFVAQASVYGENTSAVIEIVYRAASAGQTLTVEWLNPNEPDVASNVGIFAVTLATFAPEINVQGNGLTVISGDTTPSSSDHTDFGAVNTSSGTVVRTFTIQNSSDGALSVSIPTLSGATAGDFSISSAPAGSVAANGSTTFQVTFDPSAAGVRTATVSIGNDDSNENPYTFAIQGTGTAPEIDVLGNDVSIVNGDSTPSTSDATDFGTAEANGNFATSSLFFIANVGDGQLDISDITLSGTGKDEFRIVFFSDPPASVPAHNALEDSFVFFVDFGPRTPGLHEATVSIANNDSDENPYTFAIQGTGASAAPSLSIPSTSLDASNGTFSVPVNFTSDGASIASVGFGLDYQESCLTFDATDGNSDGIPDAITGLPSGFVASISHDANDTGSELDISLFDSTAPMSTLSDGALLTVAFSVKPACITTDGTTTDVTLNFAGDPAPSFSDALANDVTGTSSGATIGLQFNATPTAINLGNNSVAENAVSGATVGTLSTVDPDSGDTHTYALVSGSGDSDNASFVLDGATLKTAASFDFETKSSYSVRIRTTDNGGLNGAFEQALTINVTNVNEAPVAVADAIDPLTTIFVGGQATNITVLANDTDPENDTLSVDSVNTTGTQGSVTNNGGDVSYTAPDSNGSSSFSYQAGDGSLSSTDATVNVTYVKNDPRGDCNANGSLTAADFVATILEIFDTNDTQHNSNPAWWLIYTGDFAGSPRGCDSNAGKNGSNNTSDSVSAGDIVCTVLLFFKGNCGSSVVAAGQQTTAQLAVADASAQPGQTATVTVNFNPAGNQVAAASFALVLDPSQLAFDAADANGDGLPDAVQLTVPAGMSKSVQWNAAQNRLEVAVFGASLPLPTLGEGMLATVNLQVAATATPGATELGMALASLGDTEGQDVTVVPTGGTLTIGDGAARNLLYLPMVVR
jgi:hypothetical protein